MLVQHMIEDIKSVLAEHPQCAGYELAMARYKTEVGGEIVVQSIGSYNWDEDEEFFLNPEGASSAYQLADRLISAHDLLEELEARPEIHGFEAFARERVKVLADGGAASLNQPLWGTGYHHGAKLLYFYFGQPMPTT